MSLGASHGGTLHENALYSVVCFYETNWRNNILENIFCWNIRCKLFYLKFCFWYIDGMPAISSLSCLSYKMVGNPWNTQN
jgi:hypothetical protein